MFPPGYNCCCSCYYLAPYDCCESGAAGPIRYRIYGSIALLDTFAASGLPLKIALPVSPNCWIVSTSTTCDKGELRDWGGQTELAGACPSPSPDNCPVIICTDQCVSISAIVSTSITILVNSTYLGTDISPTNDTGTGEVGCSGASSKGYDDGPNPSLYPSASTNISWIWSVNCDGSGSVSVTIVSWEVPAGVQRGQGVATFDAAGNVTPSVETDVTFPATVTTTWSVSSPNSWTKVGSACVLEVAP